MSTSDSHEIRYQEFDSRSWEVIYRGSIIAGVDSGDHDSDGTFRADLPGFTVGYGAFLETERHFPDLESAKAWLAKNAERLWDDR